MIKKWIPKLKIAKISMIKYIIIQVMGTKDKLQEYQWADMSSNIIRAKFNIRAHPRLTGRMITTLTRTINSNMFQEIGLNNKF